jgi:phosphoglycolate phosphatase
MVRAVLFDLDGTFADTAPDLGYAVNRMRLTRGLPELPLAATRPVTSMGARGLLKVAFDVDPDRAEYPALREEFLALYEANICRESRLFPGMDAVLAQLQSRDLRWGIVTNKSEHLARALLVRLPAARSSACLIGGDTTGRLKPHPDPLVAASHAIGIAPEHCIYVGDDRRDVEAAHAAGMKAAAARWGYLNGQAPETWGADWLLNKPQDLLQVL